MTQEQFNRICEIIQRRDSLEYTKEVIQHDPDANEVRLGFFQWHMRRECWEIVRTDILDPILAKHEEMIRQEIDEQINKLNKEIEEI